MYIDSIAMDLCGMVVRFDKDGIIKDFNVCSLDDVEIEVDDDGVEYYEYCYGLRGVEDSEYEVLYLTTMQLYEIFEGDGCKLCEDWVVSLVDFFAGHIG